MKKKVLQSLVVSASILSATLVFDLEFNWQGNSMHIAHIAKALYGQSPVNSQRSDARIATSSSPNTIQLSVKEESEDAYRWASSSDGTINPTLKVSQNTANIIKIQNPTDTKHELIIDTGADVLPSSDDINPNSSGQLSFSPTMAGTFTYHCAYHPFTMKGTIQIISSGDNKP